METVAKKEEERLPGTPTAPRVSGRCIKRPRKDDETSSPKVNASVRRQDLAGTAISSPKSTNPEKTRRTWDLWTHESKNWFFDALCEFGKDFDAIYNSMAAKSRKSKTQGDIGFKNKDQVRYFYYRTWHKVSKALGDLGDMKKSVQEIYGLVNYSEMRKKIGFKALNPTNAPRLLELVMSGQTTIKVKGKNLRIKTPVCRALRSLNNVPDKYNEGPRVPTQISVELRPIDNAAWMHVQSLAHNPRVRLSCTPQRKLATIVDMMEERWQPNHMKKQNSLIAALGGLETPQELKNSIFQVASPQRLHLRLFPNRHLKPIEISLADTYSSTDVCLASYLSRTSKDEPKSTRAATELKPSVKTGSEGPEATVAKCDSTNKSSNCDTLTLQKKDNNNFKSFVPFINFAPNPSEEHTDQIDPNTVAAALVNEEACDGLASNSALGTTSQLPTTVTNQTEEKFDQDGPIGNGYTSESLSTLTIGDFYLRLGCPETVAFYYNFEGDCYPAPENRAKNILDKLVTVLTGSVCDKKIAAVAGGTAVPNIVQSSVTKRCDKACNSSTNNPTEFAVPYGIAPRVNKKEVSSLDRTTRIDLPPANRRARVKRKPISEMMIQKPLLPRLNPVPSSGAAAPHSVPNGVVIRSIMPSKAFEPPVTLAESGQPQLSLVSTATLEALITTTTTTSMLDTESINRSAQILSAAATTPVSAESSLDSITTAGVTANATISEVCASTTEATMLNVVPVPTEQQISDRLETPKKVFNFADDQVPLPSPLPALDFAPSLPCTPTKQWLNGEASNLSLGSLLNCFESPLKIHSVIPDSNSNLESKLPDVESHLHSLMNESSLDYSRKFADLAAQIARQPTGTSGD